MYRDCQREKNAQVEFKCENCGKIQKRLQSEINYNRKRGIGLYCSRKCASEVGNRIIKKSRRTGEDTVCKCGKTFYRTAREIKRDVHQYCSRECPENIVGRSERKCTECGNIMRVKKSKIKKNNCFFCNKECSR